MTTFGLSDVTVTDADYVALANVDLEVTAGSITAVIGADGAGKTTAARVMVGLRRPDEGDVSRPPRRRIGYQPEAAGTWGELTVHENLRFAAEAYGRLDRTRLDMLVEVTGLGGATDRLASRLSGGMRQKLAVAMAMLPGPALVVLDEPTTGLDPVSRAELWRLLARSADEGAAVLATTSYLDEAERAASVIVLDGGEVLAAGTAETIKQDFRGVMAVATSEPPAGLPAWRRGREWRVWLRDGRVPDGLVPVTPDLEDVVTAAAVQRGSAA